MRYRDPYRHSGGRARRAWRNRDAYPLMLVGPDEPLAFIAFAAISRWLFRHRSAFVPFTVSGAVFITSAMAHPYHARWWIPAAIATASATVVTGFPVSVLRRIRAGRVAAEILTRLYRRWGIGRSIERAYTTAVIASSGVWMSAAIAVGPTTKPLPFLAVAGTLVMGVPWWAHRRRRARVKMERTIQA